MPLSNDVRLTLKAKPLFPDKCVVCHGTPETSWPILTNKANLLISVLLPILFLFGFRRTKVPICRDCKFKFGMSRTLRLIALLVLPLALIALCWGFLVEMPRLQKRLVTAVIAIIGVIPALLWQVLHPMAIDVSFDSEGKDYEFKDLNYAKEFADLNYAEVVSVSFEEPEPSEEVPV